MQPTPADVRAGSASAKGPGSSGSDEVHSMKQDGVAAVAAGLGVATSLAQSPAGTSGAAPEAAAELLSEQYGSEDATQESAGRQGHSKRREAATTPANLPQSASVRHRQARRSPTRGGPNAVESQPSADATQPPPPSACSPIGGGGRATPCVMPEVFSADAASVVVEPLASSGRQSSAELSDQPAAIQLCDPAAPDTPPSKPPPPAAIAAAADDDEEQAQRKQQASC